MRLAYAMKKNIEVTLFIFIYIAWMMLIYYGVGPYNGDGEFVLLLFVAAESIGLAIGFFVVIVMYIMKPIMLFSELGKGLFWGPYLLVSPFIAIKLFSEYISDDSGFKLAAAIFIISFIILFTIEPKVREAFLRPILGYYN